MAFAKAKAEQAALKVSMYGPPGSGKTFTSLLIAEGLAKAAGKRVAFVDTEHGTDFYALAAPRETHPEAFDFDVLHTRSLTDALRDCLALKADTYAVVILDSMTHLWQAAIEAYRGPKTKTGGLPMHAWGNIKRPYKALMTWAINSPFHVFLLGRQGNEFVEDEETGEVKAAGVKMKAEGETQYEPHVCLRMEAMKPTGKGSKHATSVPTAFAEKDRSGVLQGRLIEWPNYDTIAKPLLGLLGKTQARFEDEDEVSARDAEAIAKAERERAAASKILLRKFEARLVKAEGLSVVEQIGKEIAEAKRLLTGADRDALVACFKDAREREADPAEMAERQALQNGQTN